MKAILKKLIMAAALVAVMAGVITGCGSKKNDSNVAKNSGDTFTVGLMRNFRRMDTKMTAESMSDLTLTLQQRYVQEMVGHL